MGDRAHLDDKTVTALAKRIAKIGPRGHGEHRNRWGTVRALVAEAREERAMPGAGRGDDEQRVWLKIKTVLAAN